MAQVNNRVKLQEWLTGRDSGVIIAIAVRAALMAAPLSITHKVSITHKDREYSALPIFRACAIAHIAIARYHENVVRFAASASAFARYAA